MLQDARSARRRDAFRQTRTLDALPSFDAYLEFLASAQKMFPQYLRPSPQFRAVLSCEIPTHASC